MVCGKLRLRQLPLWLIPALLRWLSVKTGIAIRASVSQVSQEQPFAKGKVQPREGETQRGEFNIARGRVQGGKKCLSVNSTSSRY